MFRVCIIILFTIYTLLADSRPLLSYITETVQSNSNSSFTLHLGPGSHHSIFYICEFDQIIHVSEIIQYLPFCDWLFSLHLVFLKFIYVPAYDRISVFKDDSYFIYVYTTFSLSTHL